MGMVTRVVGFRAADEQWDKMKAAWETCEAVGVPIPEEVENFFNCEPPNDKPGMEVELGDACIEYSADMESGYEIYISKLPDHVRIIRVFNSW